MNSVIWRDLLVSRPRLPEPKPEWTHNEWVRDWAWVSFGTIWLGTVLIAIALIHG